METLSRLNPVRVGNRILIAGMIVGMCIWEFIVDLLGPGTREWLRFGLIFAALVASKLATTWAYDMDLKDKNQETVG